MEDKAQDCARPNILLIATDHLRSDWLGCNGNSRVMTPQIDQLARQGVTFQAAFSECPVCVPARRVLMTGKNPHHINMLENRDEQPFPEGPKLAEVMTGSGYQSFAAGKLHTHPQRNRIGFEEVLLNEEGRHQGGLLRDDYEAFVAAHGYADMLYSHGLGNNQYALRMSPLPTEFTSTHWTAQGAMDFLDRRDPTRPFFLFVSFDKPHPPITPPAEFYELYRDVVFPDPVMGDWARTHAPAEIVRKRLKHEWEAVQKNPAFVQQVLRGVAAMVTHIDSEIGNVLGHVRELGLLDNTAIIFISDHGDNLFDHGNFEKRDFYRGSANIPYILRPPKHWVESGRSQYGVVDRHSPVGLQDVMPTILDIAGIAPPDTMDGTSLTGFLSGNAPPFREFTLGACEGSYCINDGHHKYLWFAEGGIEQLFDLATDPNDLHDLSDTPEGKPVCETLRTSLVSALESMDDEHAREGRLVSHPAEIDETALRAEKAWNNRGRHQ